MGCAGEAVWAVLVTRSEWLVTNHLKLNPSTLHYNLGGMGCAGEADVRLHVWEQF
jgi:predicted naringenin-chalcone synthase